MEVIREVGRNALKWWHAPEAEILRELRMDPDKPHYWYNYHKGYTMTFLKKYPWIFVLFAVSYVPCLWFGKWYMRDRKPFELKTPLLIWNVTLCLMSGLGAIPSTMYFFQDWHRMIVDFESHLCDIRPYATWVGLATDLFIMSKLFEWMDTIFLVLRKRRVMFLHWFHHIMTAVYCWLAGIYTYHNDASGHWFSGMNMWVHFIMYGYYAMTTLGYRFRMSFILTFLQTAQMLIGVLIVSLTPRCPHAWSKIGFHFWLGLFMYASYLILFAKLLCEKYAMSKNDTSVRFAKMTDFSKHRKKKEQ